MTKRAEKIARAGARLDPDQITELGIAIEKNALQRLDYFRRGIEWYQNHHINRPCPRAKITIQNGRIKLWDYGAKRSNATPVFVIPSLVNRAYILDLESKKSFMLFLRAAGFRPLLLDWDEPGARESAFGIDEYAAIANDIFLAAVKKYNYKKYPVIAGYCMGGIFAAAIAARHADKCGGLLLMATPWDFNTGFAGKTQIEQLAAHVLPQFADQPLIPVEFLQSLFYTIDPMLVVQKFERIGRQKPNKIRMRQFTVLEDWINDGVPLSRRVMEQCLREWYVENLTGQRKFRILNGVLDPKKIHVPGLAVIPNHDRIVPPPSALALARQLPNCDLIRAQTGHIGMMASDYAKTHLWPKIADWLQKI